MKSLIKRIIIMVLIVIVIALLMSIIFYEYMPMSIAIPEKVEAYSTPSGVKEEVEEVITEHSKETVTYEITAADLNDYIKSKSYDQSKSNPFSSYQTETVNASQNTIDSSEKYNSTTVTNTESEKAAKSHDTTLK